MRMILWTKYHVIVWNLMNINMVSGKIKLDFNYQPQAEIKKYNVRSVWFWKPARLFNFLEIFSYFN